MLLRLLSLGFCCFLLACTSKTPASSDQPFTHTSITAATYEAVRGDSLQERLIEQLCRESKGYQENTWLGLNQCIWALEKYRLRSHLDFIQRQSDTLSLQLANGQVKTYIHRGLDSEAPTYYQFQRWLPQSGLVQIERIDDQQCTQQLFVRRSDGQETLLTGSSHFPPNQAFVLLNGGTEQCRSTLEYWSLTEGQLQQKWSTTLEEGPLEKVRWTDEQQFVAQTATGYAKFNLQ